ncbi:MAG: hypothetical protein ACUZ8H_16515 [Candidatus Anammoxibacter sp.]
MDDNNLDYLPVVNRDNRIEGFPESRTIRRLIAAGIVEIQNEATETV